MHRIAVTGISLQDTDVAGLERAKRRLGRGGTSRARELADALGASELVLLSTCNRVEVAFAREEGEPPSRTDLATLVRELEAGADLLPLFHLHTGVDAVRHLLRVAASLDSLVLGEDQILAQMRDAFEAAQSQGLSGRLLGPAFRLALHTGKLVRSRTELARHSVSVVSLAVAHLRERCSGANAPRVGIVGAGAMAQLAARALTEAGLGVHVVANRSRRRGEALAQAWGAHFILLDDLRAGAEPLDALVSATASPGCVLAADELARLARRAPLGRLVAADLAVPRDLEPLDDPCVEIIDVDALRERAAANRERRAGAARAASALIDEQVEDWVARQTGRRAAETLAELSAETREILERELALLDRGELARLTDEQRKAIERWARLAFGRIEHAPIAAIKRLASDLAERRGAQA